MAQASDDPPFRTRSARFRRAGAVIFVALVLAISLVSVASRQQPAEPTGGQASRFAQFVEPVEVNAFLKLPTIFTNLQAVSFAADGQRGWAVGLDGTIVSTRDGGESWRAQTSGTEAWLSSVSFAADGLRGWAVGHSGTIVSTRDGGESWRAQPRSSPNWAPPALTELSHACVPGILIAAIAAK